MPRYCENLLTNVTSVLKNLPNMAKYPQKHLEIPEIPVAVLVMDNIGHPEDTGGL